MTLIPKNLAKKDPLIRSGASCPFCGFPFHPSDNVVFCPSDSIPHHVVCWGQNGNHCTTLGCAGSGEVAIPVTLGAATASTSVVPFVIGGVVTLFIGGLLMLGLIGLGIVTLGSPRSSSTPFAFLATSTKEIPPVIATSPPTRIPTNTVQPTTPPTIAVQPTIPSTIVPTPIPPPSPTIRPAVFFEDGFDGSSLDTSKWVLESTGNYYTVNNGTLQMASRLNRYPYIYTRFNPFPTSGNFRLSFRFRYSQVAVCGVGIIMTGYLVPSGLSQNEAAARQQAAEQTGVQAGVWQSISEGLLIWFRAGPERIDIPFGGPDRNWHEMTIVYTDSRYMIYLDDRLVHNSRQTAYRPRLIWIGHPADLGGNCDWDSLEVDNIRVEGIP